MMRKLVLATALLVVVGLHVSSSEASAQARPGSADETRLYARLLAMTDSRSYDMALVDSALASSWAPLRSASALAIGQVGRGVGLEGAPRLRDLLRDRDLVVASNAAYSLGLLQDTASISNLTAALSAAPRVAREAAWALGEIGAPARTAIAIALGNSGSDDALTVQLLLAAAKLRPVPVSDLRPYLKATGKPSVMWAAAYAIARTRAPAGVRDLINLAGILPGSTPPAANETPSGRATAEAYIRNQSGVQRVRAEIARALTRQAAGDSLGNLAYPVLTRLAADPHPHVRINAVRSLATYNLRARDAVMAATRDTDTNVRIRSEEHTSELQSRLHLVCRLLLEKKKKKIQTTNQYIT